MNGQNTVSLSININNSQALRALQQFQAAATASSQGAIQQTTGAASTVAQRVTAAAQNIIGQLGMTSQATNNLRQSTDDLSQSTDNLGQSAEAAAGRMAQSAEQTNAALDTNLRLYNKVQECITGIVQTANEWREAARVQEQAEIALSSVLRNRFNATEETIQATFDLASAEQSLGIIGDEVQLAGAKELAMFVEKQSALNTLIPLMNDMAAASKGYEASAADTTQAAQLLGKALQGNIGSLAEKGFVFTEAQKRALLLGDEEAKIAALTAVISSRVGGMNAALAKTPTGRLQQMANLWGDLKEKLGALVNTILEALTPALNALMTVIDAIISGISWFIDILEEFRPIFDGLVSAFAGAVTAILGVVAAVKAWQVAQAVLNVVLTANPIGLVITAIGALVAAIMYVVNATEGWGETWDAVCEQSKTEFEMFCTGFEYAWEGVKGLFLKGIYAMQEAWYQFSSLWDEEGSAAALTELDRKRKEIDDNLTRLDKRWALLNAKAVIGKSQMIKVKFKEDNEAEFDPFFTNQSGAMDYGNPTLPSVLDGSLDTDTTNSIATGGTRNTTVNINLNSLIETVNFASMEEDGQSLEDMIIHSLTRALNTAATSIS